MTTATTPPPSSQPTSMPGGAPPLWQQPIEVFGLTGEFGSGKTVCGLTIWPGPGTLHLDTEKSGASYLSLGHKRIDLPAEMLKIHPAGYKPIDTFVWWRDAMRSLPPGKFRVVFLDVAEEIEAGASDWVWENPLHFNHSRQQYLKMQGIYWGDVKSLWKAILADLSSRCETFAFATHTGKVWRGNEPTSESKPKGKSTLMELASLYLWMERRKDDAGNLPRFPSANVLKSRQAHIRVDGTGEVHVSPAMPPRLPVATPAEIRKYLTTPLDWSKLRSEEMAPAIKLTDDERAQMRLDTARAEGDAERLRIERLNAERGSVVTSAPETQVAAAEIPRGQEAAPSNNGHVAPVQQAPQQSAPARQTDPPVTSVSSTIASLSGDPKTDCMQLWEEFAHLQQWGREDTDKAFRASVLGKFGVTSAKELRTDQLIEIRERLIDAVRTLYASKGIGEVPF